MSARRGRRLLALALSGLALALASPVLSATPPAAPAAAARPAALYVFGDSYSDIGFGYLDGNGPTAVAYLAEGLGLQLTHTKAADWKGKSLDFAFSGGGTGIGGARDARLGYGMVNQAQEFAALVTSGQVVFDPERTLFFVAGGLNDRRLTTDQTEANLTQVVSILKGAGARHVRLANLPEKIPAFAEVGVRLNPMLAALPAKLSAQLGIDVRPSRWGSYFDGVMAGAVGFGFTNTTEACAGRAIFNQDATPCAAPSASYYYHGDHPSTAVHRLVGARLTEEVLAN